MVLGSRGRVTHAVGIAVFALFLAVSLFEAVGGAMSCGCFGKLHVNPWYTVILDGVALVALTLSGAFASLNMPRATIGPLRRLMLVSSLAVAVAGALWITFTTRKSSGISDGLLVGNGIAIIDSTSWAGKPFPLRRFTDVGDKLAKGRWIVVLYRWDCDHCQRALPRYEALAAESQQHSELPQVALIQLPPYAPWQLAALKSEAAVLGRLSSDREWFAQTPIMLELTDGIVVAAAEGEAAEAPPSRFLGD